MHIQLSIRVRDDEAHRLLHVTWRTVVVSPAVAVFWMKCEIKRAVAEGKRLHSFPEWLA